MKFFFFIFYYFFTIYSLGLYYFFSSSLYIFFFKEPSDTFYFSMSRPCSGDFLETWHDVTTAGLVSLDFHRRRQQRGGERNFDEERRRMARIAIGGSLQKGDITREDWITMDKMIEGTDFGRSFFYFFLPLTLIIDFYICYFWLLKQIDTWQIQVNVIFIFSLFF